MYHLALAVQSNDEHLGDKLDAVAALPGAADSVRVTVVHVHGGDGFVEDVPAVAEALDHLGTVGIEATATGVRDDDATRGLLDTAADLDVDAICIGGRRRSPAGKLQLKPGAQEVLLRAEVPVVVAGDLESREPRT
jgi:nucleotide-binding universal stress UspA family protein